MNETHDPECPHCKGEGRLENAHEPQCVMSYNDWCECRGERWGSCWTCDGRGRISPVHLACFNAYGGPFPIQAQIY